MAVIETRNLTKIYRVARKAPGWLGSLRHFFRREVQDIVAVRDLTFTIEGGEVVGFLGPNGAGKTTTLKMLTGLIHPTSGEVRVAGFSPWKRETAFLRNISLVMGQKQQLIWDLPALDSLRINAVVYGLEETTFRHRVAELSELLEIQHILNQPVRKLSLGERMKAELLAALLHFPRILFLDEPTLGLDVNAQAAIRQFLRAYNERYGATMILTSHYMADISALCERVILIHQGTVWYDGPLSGLLEKFAPYREIRVEFHQPIAREHLQRFGEVERVEGRRAHLIVRRKDVTDVVAQMLRNFPVMDLTIQDPPIEEIIRRVFALPGHSPVP